MARMKHKTIKGVAVAVLIVAGLRLALPTILVRVANAQLAANLQPAASLGGIELALCAGRVTLRDLRIAQPEGFGEGDFLRVERATANVGMLTLLSAPLVVSEMTIDGGEAHLVKNEAGRLNTEALQKAGVAGVGAEGSEAAGTATNTPAESAGAEGGKPLLIERIALRRFAVTYADAGVGAEPLSVHAADIDVLVTNLVVDTARVGEKVLPCAVTASLRLVQAPLPDAHVGLAARLGCVGAGLPAVNAALRAVGVELDPLGSAVPPGTAQTLGGRSLDVAVDAAVATNLLRCTAMVSTGGAKLTAKVGGTPAKPEIDKSGALFSVLGRLGGGVGNLVGNVGAVGVGVAGAAVDTVQDVGVGAVKVVGAAGGGLFKSIKGVMTGDMKSVKEGIEQATIGSVTNVTQTLDNAARGVGKGVKVVGDGEVWRQRDTEWRDGAAARWNTGWPAARREVGAMAFPEPATGDGGDAVTEGGERSNG